MRVFALTLWGKRYSHIVAFPIGEGGPRQRRSGTFVSGALEMIFPALFPAASALSAPSGHLPLEGKALSVVILFSHMRVFALMLWGEAVFSYRSLPHWGRGTASAVDRVLSYNACLRRIFHLFQLSFIPLEPYPARYARHLPLEGKADDARETCCQETFGHRPVSSS